MLWVQGTIGRGPKECDMALAGLLRRMTIEASESHLTLNILDQEHSDYGITSFLVSIEGDGCENFVKIWNGTFQWICQSQIRPNHKRKRWFVKFEAILPKQETDIEIVSADLEWDSFRASGPGGQNVQKTSSAVRLTHKPSGLVVIAQEERSQQRNKSLAMGKLYAKIRNNKEIEKADVDKKKWQIHNTLERGNAVRTFEGMEFKEKLK